MDQINYEHPDVLNAMSGVRSLLRLMGEDPEREGLLDTPKRVVKAYMELTEAPGDPRRLLGTTFGDIEYPSDQLIAVGPVSFTSVCEHHLLPFTGTAWIGYLPTEDGVVGLSKLPRLLDHYAKRPQVQERLTTQIATALMDHLGARAAGCIIKSTHTCMSLRGVKKEGAVMVTSVLLGLLRTNDTLRAEFLALTR